MSAKSLGFDDGTPPRRFWLVRHDGEARSSGVVAEGIAWSSGQVAVHWPRRPGVTSLWASIDDLLAAHGHGGSTAVNWIDTDHCSRGEGAGYDGRWVEVIDGAIFVH